MHTYLQTHSDSSNNLTDLGHYSMLVVYVDISVSLRRCTIFCCFTKIFFQSWWCVKSWLNLWWKVEWLLSILILARTQIQVTFFFHRDTSRLWSCYTVWIHLTKKFLLFTNSSKEIFPLKSFLEFWKVEYTIYMENQKDSCFVYLWGISVKLVSLVPLTSRQIQNKCLTVFIWLPKVTCIWTVQSTI